MARAGWLWLLVALAGCATPRAWAVPGSGARVVASSEDAPRLCAIIEEHEQDVIRLLGSSWDEPYEVEVGKTHGDLLAQTASTRWRRWVTIAPEALSGDIENTVIHELVHVHSRGRWLELPAVVQEGLCMWVSLLARGQVPANARVTPPDPEALYRALTLTNEEYLALEHRRDIKQAGAWLASWLLPAESTEAPAQGRVDRLPGAPDDQTLEEMFVGYLDTVLPLE